MRVLVLDGNQNQAVACVRSLARAGHNVLVGESASWSKAGWSRYCRGTFQYPAPAENVPAFVECIAATAATERGTLVLPATEATTLPLSLYRQRIFAAGASMVLPDHAEVVRAFNKEETTRLACSLGIRVPKTTPIGSVAEAELSRHSLSYPVVLKSRSSAECSGDGPVRTGGRPRYARNVEEFAAALVGMRFPILAQEFVEGAGLGYFALMRHSEVRAEFAHRRIRDVYPSGSGSALRVSVEVDPQVREASLAILRALNWHGVAMVEFRQVPGASPVFLEVNGRLWHSLALACYAGADFPAWLARLAEHGDISPAAPYRSGLRCRWWLGDLRHLLEVWRGTPSGYPGRYPSRLRTLFAELMPVAGTYHDNFNWNDPMPEAGDWLSFLGRALDSTHQERQNA